MDRIRRAARYLLLTVLAGMVLTIGFGVVGEFFIELAREEGYYEHPSEKLSAAMVSLNGFVTQPWFLALAAFIGGSTIGVWLDVLLRRVTKRSQPSVAGAPMKHVDELEVVANKQFKSSGVLLDGKRFISCSFSDTIIQWEGAEFRLEGCHMEPNCHFITQNRQLQTMLELANRIGMLDTARLKNYRGFVAEEIMRGEHSPPRPPQGT